MGKIILLCMIFYSCTLYAIESSSSTEQLQERCLYCHAQEQIPDELIYRRYLMKYSTADRMQKAMQMYLKNPQKEDSIMPAPFFSKFPIKEALIVDDETLEKNIAAFLERHDVKKKLILP